MDICWHHRNARTWESKFLFWDLEGSVSSGYRPYCLSTPFCSVFPLLYSNLLLLTPPVPTSDFSFHTAHPLPSNQAASTSFSILPEHQQRWSTERISLLSVPSVWCQNGPMYPGRLTAGTLLLSPRTEHAQWGWNIFSVLDTELCSSWLYPSQTFREFYCQPLTPLLIMCNYFQRLVSWPNLDGFSVTPKGTSDPSVISFTQNSSFSSKEWRC